MLRKSGYHRPPKKQKNGSKRQTERQLQLPLQPHIMQIKRPNDFPKPNHRYTIIKILIILGLILTTLLISTAYNHLLFKNATSDLSLKFEEIHPSSIEDIIEALKDDEQNLFDESESNLINKDIYNFYGETLSDENALKADEKKAPVNVSSQPLITIVIDDMGININHTKNISSLKYPITASFLTYATNLKSQIAKSKANGQEIMAHIPMEPQVMQNFTSKMLTTTMSDTEIKQNLKEMLDLFSDITAINNHMGSKFTEDKHRMTIVMEELAQRDLIFLDSKTTSHSTGAEEAKRHGVKYAERNVFLDNKDDFNYIMGQLRQTEEIARSHGHAIAIGHPKEQTYLALKAWLPTLKEKGFHLVPLSKIVQ